MIGVTLADGNFIQFSQSLGVVFFHIAGAAVSGYLISSHLWLRIVFGSLMVGTAAIINVFFPNSILLYFFAAMFTGLQNSTSSRWIHSLLPLLYTLLLQHERKCAADDSRLQRT
jgi:hypothetical protein